VEERYRNLVENLPVGIGITSMEGKFLVANRTIQKMRGYDSREELMRTNVAERYYDPKDRDRWLALIKEEGRVDGFEIRLKRKDSSIFWASFNSILQTTVSGEQQIINVAQDITERKKVEEALRISEERYRNLIENLPVGVAINSPNGQTFMVNKALQEMAGYDSKEEQLRTPILEHYYDTKDRERWLALIKEKGKVKDAISYKIG